MSPTGLPRRLFKQGAEPNGERVHEYGNLSIIEDIRASLPEHELKILADSQFGKLLDVPQDAAYAGKLIHFLLTRQLVVINKHEIWFIFGGSPIRFSISEFQAVTGLSCNKLPKQKKRPGKRKILPGKYWYNLFDRPDVSVDWVVNRLKKRLVGDRDTRLRFALLALIDGVLCPTSRQCKISPDHVEMCAHLDKFILHPWGTTSFDMTLESIQARGAAKLKKKSISVQGFPHALQLVLLKSVPLIKELHFKVEDGDSDMEVEEPEISRLWTLKLEIVWKVDGKSGCSVMPCIGELSDGTVSECCSWSDEEEDSGVSNILQIIREKKQFGSAMFVGGNVPDEVADAGNGNSDNGSNEGQTPGTIQGRKSNRARMHVATNGGAQRILSDATKKYIDMKVKGSEKRVLKAVADSEQRVMNMIEKKWGQAYGDQNCANKSAGQSRPHVDPNQSLPGCGPNHLAQSGNPTGGGTDSAMEGLSNLGPAVTHSVLPDVNAGHARSSSTIDSPPRNRSSKKRKPNPMASSIGAIVSDQPAADAVCSSIHVPPPLQGHTPEVANDGVPILLPWVSNSATMGLVQPWASEVAPATSMDAIEELNSNPDIHISEEGQMAEDSGTRMSKEKICSQANAELMHATNSAIGDSYPDNEVNMDANHGPQTAKEEICSQLSPSKLKSPVPAASYSHLSDKGTASSALTPAAILSSQTSPGDRNMLEKIIRIISQEGRINFGNSQYLTSSEIRAIIDLKSYISPVVMDIIFNTIRRTWELYPPIEHHSKIAFRDSTFVHSLCSHFPKFSKAADKGMYSFDEGLLSSCPTEVHKVYVPFNIDNRHWVCLCVDLEDWSITVIDCFPSAWREAKIKTFVQPFAEMYPHLVRYATSKAGKKKVMFKPLFVQREKDMPQACYVGQSGVMSAYLSEVHALGGLHACKLVTLPEVFQAAKKYVIEAYEVVNGSA